MLQTCLAYQTIPTAVSIQSERAGSAAALFLLLLGVAVLGAFVWAGYRLIKREKERPPAYAEFLGQDAIEEVDAEFEGGWR
ncbi:MAG: hypothetical protein AB7T14_07890 [Candidatus Methylacidiphilaceae bacterium]